MKIKNVSLENVFQKCQKCFELARNNSRQIIGESLNGFAIFADAVQSGALAY
jgi:cytochrome c2